MQFLHSKALIYSSSIIKLYLAIKYDELLQTGLLYELEELSIEKFKDLLRKRIEEIDFDQAKKDVIPFINNSSKLSI